MHYVNNSRDSGLHDEPAPLYAPTIEARQKVHSEHPLDAVVSLAADHEVTIAVLHGEMVNPAIAAKIAAAEILLTKN